MYGTDRYYVREALDAMGKAHGLNSDLQVGTHISRAMDALRELSQLRSGSVQQDDQPGTDPYEMSEFNSAV